MLPLRRACSDHRVMARQPRFDLPGIPQHIVQRGNNRLPCFLDDVDRAHYLSLLREALLDTECMLHAYVLMDNHVHLLVSPACTGAVSRLMQKLGRRYVRQFNLRHRRTGTLWEGRYKSCLVDSRDYLLRCYQYIDLNPVRARMTDVPESFRWSSCRAHCAQEDPLVTHHRAYLELGSDTAERAAAYQAILYEPLSDDLLDEIRNYLQQQRALGCTDFQHMIQAKTQRFAGIRPAHRPRKER